MVIEKAITITHTEHMGMVHMVHKEVEYEKTKQKN